MGNVSRALGQGATFDYNGKTYQVSPWTYGIQGKFEQHLEEHALKTMRRMKSYLNADEYADLIARTREDIDTGAYSFGSANIAKAMSSLVHTKYLFYLMLNAKQPTSKELVDELCENDLELVMNKMAEANADPTQGSTPNLTPSQTPDEDKPAT